jgi:hypothetical protein
MPKIFQDFTNSIAIPITLTGLLNTNSIASSAIDNSTDLYIAANVQFTIGLGAGTVAGGTITVYILRSVDNGATYDDLSSNAEILGVFNANDTMASTTIKFSVDTNIVGTLPDFWEIAVTNNSGDTLASGTAVMTGKLLLIM